MPRFSGAPLVPRAFTVTLAVALVAFDLAPAGPGESPASALAAPKQARPPRQGRGSRGADRGQIPDLAKPPLARSGKEKRILAVIDEMAKDRTRRYLSVSPEDGRLLRLLTETAGAKTVVELGTSTGFSGLWFCLALQATGGKLITHELDPGRAKTARDNFEKAGVSDLVTIVLGDGHEKVKEVEGPIDVIFLDADKKGYIDYLEKLLPKLRPGGLILAHNMHFPTPDPRYIEAITTRPELDSMFFLMEGAGVGVTLKKR